jgi:hypothetical protein
MQTSKLFLLSIFVFCPLFVFGQERDDENDFSKDAVIVNGSVNVRANPSKRFRIMRVLEPDTPVRVIDTVITRGYFRVLFGNGEQGYAWSENVRVIEESSSLTGDSLTADSSSSEPCVSNFVDCEPRGCADPNSPQALFNEAKRRTPVGDAPILISFADLSRMQDEIGLRLGVRSQNKALSQEERNQLLGITVTNGTIGESTLVKIVGFIPTGTGLKTGAIETVNCRLTEAVQRDIHIPLVQTKTKTEFQGIVIEMIPQGRPANWTLARLRKARDNGRKVMVVGGLFYDNDHLVNKDPNHVLSGHSKRFTIWEVHPVTQFFVCTRSNNSCSAANVSQWVKLEDF